MKNDAFCYFRILSNLVTSGFSLSKVQRIAEDEEDKYAPIISEKAAKISGTLQVLKETVYHFFKWKPAWYKLPKTCGRQHSFTGVLPDFYWNRFYHHGAGGLKKDLSDTWLNSFDTWCLLKSHIYLNLQLKATDLFKYVWPFYWTSVVKGLKLLYIAIWITFGNLTYYTAPVMGLLWFHGFLN